MANKTFSSFSEFQKLIEQDFSTQGSDSLSGGLTKSKKEILAVAKELKKEILKSLTAKVYLAYTPTMYKRTYKTTRSLSLGGYGSVNLDPASNTLSVDLLFNDNAWQPNVNKKHMSFVPGLLNYGWKLLRAYSPGLKNNKFYYYKGTSYINNAISRIEARYPEYNIKLNLGR